MSDSVSGNLLHTHPVPLSPNLLLFQQPYLLGFQSGKSLHGTTFPVFPAGFFHSKIAKATGISATTLYSIIQKDSNIRFDFALRLANELQIDVNEICSASPFSGTIKEEEIYPTLPDGLNGALDATRVKTYLKNSMYPLMYLFGKNSIPDVDNLLTSFYQLDDEARQEVVETIRLKLQYHRDPERAEQIKQIKGW